MGKTQVVNFMTPPRSYVVHNATDGKVEVSWNSTTFTLPPSDQIIEESKENNTRYSAKDSNGTYIPGTLVLADKYREADPWLGGQELLWSASEAIKNALGIDTTTGEASGVLAIKGVSLLPFEPAPEVVAAVVAEGKKRFEEFRIVEAEQIVAAHEAANQTRKQLGMPEIPGNDRYITASMVLQKHRTKLSERTRKLMGLDEPVIPAKTDPLAGLDMTALADKLLDNPSFAKTLHQREVMRKKSKSKAAEV